MFQNITNLFNEKKLSDVLFMVGEEKMQFHGHKLIFGAGKF